MKKLLILTILLFSIHFSFSQTKKDNSLIKNLVTRTPGDILGDNDNICNLKYSYLGQAKAKQTFYIATLSLDWGPTCRNTTRILIYDKQLKFLGNFYTNGLLPTSLDKNTLLGQDFESVDFSNGIPDSIQAADIWTKFDK